MARIFDRLFETFRRPDFSSQNATGPTPAAVQSPTLASGQGLERSANPFFPPLPPFAPVAQSAIGRQYDFPIAGNIFSERPGLSFQQLRDVAKCYDVLRLVIETRKDQLAGQAWTVGPRDANHSIAPDPRVPALLRFLARPDGVNPFSTWLRALIEDLLVIDAACLYVRRDVQDTVIALELMDGATIRPLMDGHGRVPLPPDAAYQQRIKGLPAVDYTHDELLYLARNARTYSLYGFSPVEQVINTVNLALARQSHQLQYYTEGSTPDLIFSVPSSWSYEQTAAFSDGWNRMLSGNTAERRRTRFVPDGVKVIDTKEAALKDSMDEWLARVISYAFSVSPQWALGSMNRATSETAQSLAATEGLEPIKLWVQEFMNDILDRQFNCADLEFKWSVPKELGAVEQSAVNERYVRAGIMSVNEVRATMGLAPVEGGDACRVYGAQATALAGAGSQNASSQNGNGVGSSQHATSGNGSQNASSGNGSQNAMQIAKTAEWNEDLHPRDKDGQFTFTGQGVNGSGVNGSAGAVEAHVHESPMELSGTAALIGSAGQDQMRDDSAMPDPQGPGTPDRTGKGDSPLRNLPAKKEDALPSPQLRGDGALPATPPAPPSATPPAPPANTGPLTLRGGTAADSVVVQPPAQRQIPAQAQMQASTPRDPAKQQKPKNTSIADKNTAQSNMDSVGLSKDCLIEDAIANFNNLQDQKKGLIVPQNMTNWIIEAARRYNMDPAILATIVNAEAATTNIDGRSVWNPDSKNFNAVGLGQFMPKTWFKMAMTKGTYLNDYCRANGYIDDNNNLVPRQKDNILDLRTNAKASIMAIGQYALDNLNDAQKKGLIPTNADGQRLADMAYIMHHEGPVGGMTFINDRNRIENGQDIVSPTQKQEDNYRQTYLAQLHQAVKAIKGETPQQHTARQNAADDALRAQIETEAQQWGSVKRAYHDWLDKYVRKNINLSLFQRKSQLYSRE